jgi:two-component SAPR family response regulator
MSRENSNSILTSGCDNELQTADLMRLCVKSLEAKIEVEFVQQLIKKLNLRPDQSAIALENWPWPVRIYTLGAFSVEIDGQTLEFEGKAQKKPLELLKALLALGSRNINNETLTETLYPDAEGDDAHQALATTLHRLRKLIGHEAITQQQGQLSLSPEHYWSDLRSFEYFMSAAANELAHNHLEESWQSTQRALSLYKGAFLVNDSASHWVLSMRERVRRKLLHHIHTICSRLCQNNCYEQAMEGYLKGLDVDDLQEHFYRGLIICHQNLGQEAEAISVYKQCHTLLTTILGLEPTKETKSLIE